MTKNKKGFTLIELMVVIVIIGILAAIAIPKLFGVTAKAKASEVGPASGSWSKMQQAYVSEKSAVGSFARIGYTPPGATATNQSEGATAFFKYTSNLNATDVTSDVPLAGGDLTTGEAVWQAENTGNLGDCKTGAGKWVAQVDAETGTATAIVSDVAAECIVLTPNFKSLK